MKSIFRFIISALIFSSTTQIVQAQILTESNLPIVVISTDINTQTNQPLEILDDPRILATMQIISRPDGSRNYITDVSTTEFLNYNGRISIEIRGSSSQATDKKGYGFTTLLADNVSNNNISLLGMPKENDWILNGLAFDPSLIRDYLSYNLSSQMGNYAPRTQYCEVVINGDYRGLYVLQEKIKVDGNRVNISDLLPTSTTAPNLTGGYIVKSDKTTGGDPVAWQMISNAGGVDFIYDTPEPDVIVNSQKNYIKNQFLNLGVQAAFNNTSISNGFPSIIDIPSFVDFMISNELASNADGYQFSTYFHKDKGGKLRAGPVWDFNLTYGNDLFQWGFDRSKYDVWQFSDGGNEGAKFWTDLFNNPIFRCYFTKRWNELIQPGQPLKHNNLVNYIDAIVSQISEATVRENIRWGTIPDHALEIENMKLFLYNRINWINEQLGSYTACANVAVPNLVISRIHYNPDVSATFPISDDQEFIEITNASNQTVSVTGIYFKELGFSYQFPSGTLGPNQRIYLASNPTVFQSKYGLTAYGQFYRNLSNSSEKLILADAFGNTIDEVTYDDATPWPDADGNGAYLQLISTSLDNNLASSWVNNSSGNLPTTLFNYSQSLHISPNPVQSKMELSSLYSIGTVRIFSSLGQELLVLTTSANKLEVDVSTLTSGVYIIQSQYDTGNSFVKFIKQ
ncbi:MAG: T9SS type A sorting domain-containing protein [Flavobacterium sp.]|nr:T9SS type A sorting domain-containing protein [Flavobacterium sp.]